MFKGRFFTLRYIVSFCFGGAITLMFLVLYLMLEEDAISLTKIAYIAYALLLAYFALFANEAINSRRHIANSSYLFLLLTTLAISGLIGYTLAVGNHVEVVNELIEAYKLTPIILSGLTLLFQTMISMLTIFKMEEARRGRVKAVTHIAN